MTRQIHGVMKDAKDLDHRPIFVRSDPKHHNMPTLATGASDVQREQTLQNNVAASDAWNVWPIWQGLDGLREFQRSRELVPRRIALSSIE
jgi:hypothetical protein